MFDQRRRHLVVPASVRAVESTLMEHQSFGTWLHRGTSPIWFRHDSRCCHAGFSFILPPSSARQQSIVLLVALLQSCRSILAQTVCIHMGIQNPQIIAPSHCLARSILGRSAARWPHCSHRQCCRSAADLLGFQSRHRVRI